MVFWDSNARRGSSAVRVSRLPFDSFCWKNRFNVLQRYLIKLWCKASFLRNIWCCYKVVYQSFACWHRWQVRETTSLKVQVLIPAWEPPFTVKNWAKIIIFCVTIWTLQLKELDQHWFYEAKNCINSIVVVYRPVVLHYRAFSALPSCCQLLPPRPFSL